MNCVYYRLTETIGAQMDKEHTDKLIKMIQRGELSSHGLMKALLDYSAEDRSELDRVIVTIKIEAVWEVWRTLTATYPRTELGWSILPVTRSAFLKDGLGSREISDIRIIPFQEDQPHVEYLGALLCSLIGRIPME